MQQRKRESGRELIVDPSIIHHRWIRDLSPALEIDSGDTVHFDLKVAGDPNIREGSTASDAVFDWETIYNLSGPIYVRGAMPGDTLQVEIVDLRPGDWGWVAILPNLGLLPEDFPDPVVKTLDLRDGHSTRLCEGVDLPISPFLGTMGTHPGEPDGELPFPPHRGGGNMDNRHLTQGAVLYLPVWCEGAQFSCGDPHALQGDGEVCVTALECPMRATLRFSLLKSTIPTPQFRTRKLQPQEVSSGGECYGTSGITTDLMSGAKAAVRAMITLLQQERQLSAEDAYMLCSLAGDLKIYQIVAPPTYNVGMMVPLSIFA